MNEQWIAAFQIVVGLATLIFGGEILVRGASAIAVAMRIPPLIIGLTVVAFGTSAPELGVSLQAAFSDSADVAVGNVVGSSIFNVLFILGIAAVISPLAVSSQLIRFDVPLMIGVSVLTWVLSRDGTLDRVDGALLFTVLIGYLFMCYRNSRRGSKSALQESVQELEEAANEAGSHSVRLPLQFAFIIGGLICLGLGSKWLVDGAVSVATWLGVSELIIGLTIVAVGTSLPEIVTSVVAALRGARDIAVGNIVGSNIFNLGCVFGLSALAAPLGIAVGPEAIAFDMPVMIAVAVLCFPIFFTGLVIARWEGILFLTYYVAYTTLIILTQTRPLLAGDFGWVLGYIVVPATLLPLAISFFRSVANPKRARKSAR